MLLGELKLLNDLWVFWLFSGAVLWDWVFLFDTLIVWFLDLMGFLLMPILVLCLFELFHAVLV